MITNKTVVLDNAARIARDMRGLMDDVYDGEREESDVTPMLNKLFDQVLPHYQELFEFDPWAAEQFVNVAEWLDRLDDVPDTI